MSQSTLADELLNLTSTPQSLEADAIVALVNAYGNFAAEAESNGTSVSAAGIDLGKAAMAAALVTMSQTNQALTLIPQAVKTFWQAVCGSAAVSFPGSISASPPPHDNLDDLFPPVCTANSLPAVDSVTAANALAAVLYAEAIIAGTVTFPGPAAFPLI